jgi:hypothetical protein
MAFARACGRCEFCGNQMSLFELHHRWYPKNDTLKNLMAIHRECHEKIHFGGKINATSDSLASNGDTGKGMTIQWRQYLESKNT